MYHSVYGFTKIVSPRGIDYNQNKKQRKKQIYGNYDIKLKYNRKLIMAIVDEIPFECIVMIYTFHLLFPTNYQGYYYIYLYLRGKTSGRFQKTEVDCYYRGNF